MNLDNQNTYIDDNKTDRRIKKKNSRMLIQKIVRNQAKRIHYSTR